MNEITIVPLTDEEEAAHLEYVAEQKIVDEQRINDAKRFAYQNEADPLFFKWQRGETGFTEKVWKSKIAEIDARFNKEPESITLEGEK